MRADTIFQPGLFKGQTALITGGGSGINFGIADLLASLGMNIAICGRTESKLTAAAEKLRAHNVEVFHAPADVRDPEALEQFFEGSRKALGPGNIVVAGAAGNFLCDAKSMSTNAFKTVVDIDLVGSFNTAKAGYEQLCETSGQLLMISAAQAFMPFALQAHAGAAKAGVEQLMRQLALEWGVDGIRVNAVVPGPIEGTEGMARLASTAVRDTLLETIPLGRLGQTEDIGSAVAFLASPLASYITGASLIVDGGQYLSGTGVMNSAVRSVMKTMGNAA